MPGKHYRPETLRKLAAEAGQFSVAHSRNGERRTADLLYRAEKALNDCAKVIAALTPTNNEVSDEG